jgi:hypothetical protein
LLQWAPRDGAKVCWNCNKTSSCPMQENKSSNTVAHTLLVSINWQFILLFSPCYVLILLSVICCFIYVKQSWLLNVNVPLETWFGKRKYSILFCKCCSLCYILLHRSLRYSLNLSVLSTHVTSCIRLTKWLLNYVYIIYKHLVVVQ